MLRVFHVGILLGYVGQHDRVDLIDQWVELWVDQVDRWIDRWVDRWVDQVDRWIDQRVDRCADQVDWRVDGQVEVGVSASVRTGGVVVLVMAGRAGTTDIHRFGHAGRSYRQLGNTARLCPCAGLLGPRVTAVGFHRLLGVVAVSRTCCSDSRACRSLLRRDRLRSLPG